MKKLLIILLIAISIDGFGVDPLKPINWTGVRVSLSEMIINGDSVRSDNPTTGQVLKFDGSKWAKGDDAFVSDSANLIHWSDTTGQLLDFVEYHNIRAEVDPVFADDSADIVHWTDNVNIGTTAVTLNRASAGLTLAGLTLTTPNIGAATGTSLAATGAITSSSASAGVGYADGAGGTVTQATNKNTAVTINTITGQITTHNESIGTGTTRSFVVNNSSVAIKDVPVVAIADGTVGAYLITVSGVTSGTFTITLRVIGVSNYTDSIVINFAIIKGA